MISIVELLRRVNLVQYVENLEINGINDVTQINENILQTIGVDKIGHVKRIMTELSRLDLNTSMAETSSTEDDTPPPPLPVKSKRKGSEEIISIRPDNVLANDRSKRSSTIPANFKTADDYYRMPPVPPRRDLGESGNSSRISPLKGSNSFSFPPPPSDDSTDNKPIIQPIPAPRKPPRPSPPVRTVTNVTNESLPDPPSCPDPKPLVSETEPSSNKNESPLQPQSPDLGEQNHIPELNSPGDSGKSLNGSEDESDDNTFPDGDEDDVLVDEKATTISFKKDGEQFQQLLTESNLNRSRSRVASNRQSQYIKLEKCGYLMKKGGQKGNKPTEKRFVEFDGSFLRYYKEVANERKLKQSIPVSRMLDLQIETTEKKPTFHLITPNRKFTFIEPTGDSDEMKKWAHVLMKAIIEAPKEDGPDKEGWLLKQGHSVVSLDFSARYVVIDNDKLTYYKTYEDYMSGNELKSLGMALTNLCKVDRDHMRFYLRCHDSKQYVFQAKDLESFDSWVRAINCSVQKGLSDGKALELLQLNESNKLCADCKSKNAIYASINLFVVICDECAGKHREMSTRISRTQSILMDVNIWKRENLVKLFQTLGNEKANSLWASKLPPDEQIRPEASSEDRNKFIREKYVSKKYFGWSQFFGQAEELGKALRETVVTDNILETLRLIVSDADIFYIPEGSEDQRTPYELAKDANQQLQMELLAQYGGDMTLEQRKRKEEEEEEEKKRLEELSNTQETPQEMIYEKNGLLMMRMNEKENWRDAKLFQLRGRRIEFKRSMRPEDVDFIDLTQMEEISKSCEEQTAFTIRTSTKTFFLKANTMDECTSWYTHIKNKQVFGVPLEVQEVGENQIPFIMHKCLKYMELNAMTDFKTLTQEGIYRRNGSQVIIKRLRILFNQDPSNVKLNIEEYADVHAITGLLKLYLRELPEPILTKELKDQFVANTDTKIDHNERMYRYKDLVKMLPEINRICLRSLVIHLNLVAGLSDLNLMTTDNVVTIFGPIIVSCALSTNQLLLNREMAVLKDLLTYYDWLFDVDEKAIKNNKAMIDILKKNSTQAPPADDPGDFKMQIPFYVQIRNDKQERQMQMLSSTRPRDVCEYAVNYCGADAGVKWSLFEEILNGSFSRPVSSKESVMDLAFAIQTSGELVVKENYVEEIINKHKNGSLGLQGYLNYSTKGEKWKKNYFVEIKHGNIIVCSKKDSKEEENLSIHELVLYIGVVEKKPPGRFGFMLKLKNATRDSDQRYFCSDNEYEVNMFISAILHLRYPTGVWSDQTAKELPLPNEGENKRCSMFWGRQSVVLQPQGVSRGFVGQLQEKRNTLKKKYLRN